MSEQGDSEKRMVNSRIGAFHIFCPAILSFALANQDALSIKLYVVKILITIRNWTSINDNYHAKLILLISVPIFCPCISEIYDYFPPFIYTITQTMTISQ